MAAIPNLINCPFGAVGKGFEGAPSTGVEGPDELAELVVPGILVWL